MTGVGTTEGTTEETTEVTITEGAAGTKINCVPRGNRRSIYG